MIELIAKDAQGNKTIILGECLGTGSNSNVYQCIRFNGQKVDGLVAKCPKSKVNYISFNLQFHSMELSKILNADKICIPKVLFYGKSDEVGEVLLMERMDNLYPIDFILNQSLYYGELIIRLIARFIVFLHKLGVSGYDIEFYWDALHNKLVVLDLGPAYTFGVNVEEMLTKHWEIEKDNEMGKWNIIAQILPVNRAKDIFKSKNYTGLAKEELLKHLDQQTVQLHTENVAKIHFISVIGKLNAQSHQRYLQIFKNEYLKGRGTLTVDSLRYLKSFESALGERHFSAKAKLYYPTTEVLSEESCCSVIE